MLTDEHGAVLQPATTDEGSVVSSRACESEGTATPHAPSPTLGLQHGAPVPNPVSSSEADAAAPTLLLPALRIEKLAARSGPPSPAALVSGRVSLSAWPTQPDAEGTMTLSERLQPAFVASELDLHLPSAAGTEAESAIPFKRGRRRRRSRRRAPLHGSLSSSVSPPPAGAGGGNAELLCEPRLMEPRASQHGARGTHQADDAFVRGRAALAGLGGFDDDVLGQAAECRTASSSRPVADPRVVARSRVKQAQVLDDITIRNPLAKVISRSGQRIRREELSQVFERQADGYSHAAVAPAPVTLKSPMVHTLSLSQADKPAANAQLHTRSQQLKKSSGKFDLDIDVELTEAEVDQLIFHSTNTAEIKALCASFSVLEYAKQPLVIRRPRPYVSRQLMPASATPASESGPVAHWQAEGLGGIATAAASPPGASTVSRSRLTGAHRTTATLAQPGVSVGPAAGARAGAGAGAAASSSRSYHAETVADSHTVERIRREDAKQARQEIIDANLQWEERLATNVLQLFRADLNRRALAPPEQQGNFYFDPELVGTTNPVGERVRAPPSLLETARKLGTTTRQRGLTGTGTGTSNGTDTGTTGTISRGATFGAGGTITGTLPVIATSPAQASSGAGRTGHTATSSSTSKLALPNHSTSGADVDRILQASSAREDPDDEASAGAVVLAVVELVAERSGEAVEVAQRRGGAAEHAQRPVSRVAVDRHGVPVHTTSGGGGNAPGVARLGTGVGPVWIQFDDGAVVGRGVWCGVAAIAAAKGFAGAGFTEPDALVHAAGQVAVCSHEFCGLLSRMEVDLQYMEFVGLAEQFLLPLIQAQPHTDLDAQHWRQLVVTTGVFASRATRQGDFPKALSLVRKAEALMASDLDMTKAIHKELDAFVTDAYAHYLMVRGRMQSALECTRKASKLHIALGQYAHLAKSRMHTAFVLSKNRKHAEAIKYLDQVLAMVDDGLLELGGVTSRKLCMVAMAFHNKAVEQLLLHKAQDACVSMQSCKRIAKLCLGECSSYQSEISITQAAVLEAMTNTPEMKALTKGLSRKAVLAKLTDDFFAE